MAKHRVVENFIGGGRNTTTVNVSSSANAIAVVQALGGGSLQVYEESSLFTATEPLATLVPYNDVTVLLKNPTANKSTFVNLMVDGDVGEPEIITKFTGLTINGVKAEDVKITRFNSYDA